MEDKNRASEMLSQMKRFIHSDSIEKEASSRSDKSGQQTSAPEKVEQVKKPAVSERKREIPTDESLFEFDEITFDDVIIPEKPTLTPEEAVYAEELSEKFGVSLDAGVGFLDDSAPVEEKPRSFAPSAEEIASASEGKDEGVSVIEENVTQTFEAAEEEAVSIVSEVKQAAIEGIAEAEEAIGEIADEAQGVYGGISAEVSLATDEMASEAADITEQTDVAFEEIAAPAEAVAADAWQTVREISDEAESVYGELSDRVEENVPVIEAAVDEIADEAQNVYGELSDKVEESVPVIEAAVDDIADEAQNVYDEIAYEVETVVDGLAREVDEVAPDVEPTLSSIADKIEGGIESVIESAEETLHDIAREIEDILPEKDIPVIKQKGEPDQVVFGIEEQVKAPSSSTPTGTQLTFLDAFAQIDERETSGEQVMFGDEDELPAEETEEEYPLEADEEDEVTEFVQAQVTDEPAVQEQGDVIEEISAPEPDDEEETENESPAELELTPLEQSAIEEAERARLEEQAANEEKLDGEKVKVGSFENDVWDDADRELYVAKKRYMEYCDQLSVPPIKTTKDKKVASSVSGEKNVSSGYRYEMTERLPLFSDGRNGGRKTESYVKREMEYCEEREKKRTAQLLDRMRSSGRRLIFSFVIMLTVILVENLNVIFTGKPDGLLNADNMMLLSLALAALLAVGAALIYDGIRDGIKCAVKGVFIPETLSAGVSILAIIYHIAIAFVGGMSKYTMLFGTGAAVVMFLTGLYRYNMQKRDYITFSVTASYGAYLTEVKMLGFKNSPEGKAYEGYADPEAALYRMNRVSRIDAPYNENPTRDECFGIMRKLTLCIICAAVVSGVVFGIIKNDAVYGVISAISLVTFAIPASAFVALSVPRLRAATVSAEFGGAIADFDDESDEFDTGVIMIDDGELFPPENLVSSGFEMQRSPGIEIHLARTLALFKKIGGTLSALFSNVEGTIENFDSIVITEITENGISAKIDGVVISAGSEGYMEKLGIKIKKSDKLLPRNGRVMYIADNGEFFARATLIFTPDAELVNKISELRNTDTLFSLKSCNPCIDKELLFYTTGLEPELLQLVKFASADNVAPAETDREGSLVSQNGALGLLTALLEYKRQKKLVFDATRGACISCAIGIFLSLLVSAFGYDYFGFSSLLAIGFHGIMSFIGFVSGHRGVINTKSKIKKR